jgi:glycosyltransferase involved in cell wall biosynthesis
LSGERGRTALVVLNGETVGGASLSILRIAPELERRGWRLRFWAARPSPLFDEVERRGHEVDGAPLPFLGYSRRALAIEPGAARRLGRAPRYFGGLSRTISGTRPDVVHLNSLYTTAEALVVRAHRVPALLHVHEMVAPGWKGSAARLLVHGLSGAVAGVSDASAAALSTPRHPALTVREGVGDEGVLARTPGPTTTVGTIGVISPRKGTDVFAEAARIVAAESEGVEFRIAGGADNPLDREFARALLAGLDDLGIQHAERVDSRTELQALDLFAMPSRSDPFPLAVLEAMSAGVPVVGSRVDGIAEQLAGDAGVLVEPGNPRALADAILALHTDPERRRILGLRGRERALSLYSLERQAGSLERAYRAAMA